MKALVTVEDGKMFCIDTGDHCLILMDNLGKPVARKPLQQNPIVVPGCPLIFSDRDGMETTAGKVVQVIYSQ
jgi:hypothetical protein